mgnify:CR=1 FL=1
MNNNELVRELEKQMARYGYCDTRTHIEIFIKEYEALTKDKKPIRLKDVIKHIKGFDDKTKLKWTYDILKELGSDFALKIFHEGYQQGKFEGSWVGNQLKDADKILQKLNKPVVKQFVADWITHSKNIGRSLFGAMSIFGENTEIKKWMQWADNQETFARAWLDGYEVEKEPKYIVKIKGILKANEVLNYKTNEGKWVISSGVESTFYRTKHTRKQLEEAGFGWVFDCPGIKIEEVE